MFISLNFWIALIILFAIYCFIPAKTRKHVLLLFSIIFVASISTYALITLSIATVITYLSGIFIEKFESKISRKIAISTLVIYFFIILGLKNVPFIIDLFSINTLKSTILNSIVLPVGFSFYIFSAISYIEDVYNRKEKAENDFISFALFMSFFAKFVSGPIERKGTFISQLNSLEEYNPRNIEKIERSLSYIIWGLFLKLVVAERLALIVNDAYSNVEHYDSIWLILVAIFYSFQIYSDFAGYTNIAIGCGSLFGIELTDNFNAPYLALNISDFWRRWHISLSSWLKDYIYIPLGGNRKGLFRKNINTLIVFLLCGIWHGNGFSFIVWGLLHGAFSIIDSLINKTNNITGIKLLISRLWTFILVSFAWIFFRADSLQIAIKYISSIVLHGIDIHYSIDLFAKSELTLIQIMISMLLVLLILVVDSICLKMNSSLPEIIQKQTLIKKYMFYYLFAFIIFVIGIYGGDFKTETFIYMQF